MSVLGVLQPELVRDLVLPVRLSPSATGPGAARAALRRLRGWRFAGRSPGSGASCSPAGVATGYGGTNPCSSTMRRRRWRYVGSRSFHSVSTGAAMKIDEYVPDAIPTSSAKAKSFSVSPPNSSSAATPISVHIEVASDRVSTSLIERLTIWEKAARGMRGAFSRIRSNTITTS